MAEPKRKKDLRAAKYQLQYVEAILALGTEDLRL